MAHIAFKIMAAVICLNLASGIVFEIFPQTRDETSKTAALYRNSLTYDSDYNFALINGTSGALKTEGDVVAPTNTVNYLLNLFTMGIYHRIESFYNNYLVGAATLLEKIFRPMLEQEVADFIFPSIRILIDIVYATAFWYLWTGRNIAG